MSKIGFGFVVLVLVCKKARTRPRTKPRLPKDLQDQDWVNKTKTGTQESTKDGHAYINLELSTKMKN